MRVYSISFFGISVSGISDLLEIEAPTSGMIEIRSVRLGQTTDAGDAQAELLSVSLTRYSTNGTGGTAVTPRPHNLGHAALTGDGQTYFRNRTAQGGTPIEVVQDVWNIQAPWLYVPVHDERIWIPPAGILSLELTKAPGSALDMTSTITFAMLD